MFAPVWTNLRKLCKLLCVEIEQLKYHDISLSSACDRIHGNLRPTLPTLSWKLDFEIQVLTFRGLVLKFLEGFPLMIVFIYTSVFKYS